jgi:hypothetical protein
MRKDQVTMVTLRGVRPSAFILRSVMTLYVCSREVNKREKNALQNGKKLRCCTRSLRILRTRWKTLLLPCVIYAKRWNDWYKKHWIMAIHSFYFSVRITGSRWKNTCFTSQSSPWQLLTGNLTSVHEQNIFFPWLKDKEKRSDLKGEETK